MIDVEAVRALTAGTLAETGTAGRESIPYLIHDINDESMRVRRQAAEALGMVGSEAAAVPALIDALGDEVGGVLRSVVLTLARVGPEAAEAVPALVRALRDPDKHVRGKAAHALHRINTPEAHEELLKFLLAFRWTLVNNL